MSFEVRRHNRWLSRSAEGNIGALPSDLIFHIFLRLSSKTIAICRCVSKLWASLLGSPNFTELFLTQSATRPRLLFSVRRRCVDWWLYSCPQPQISDKNLSVTAEFHMSLYYHWVYGMSPSISGLIYSPCSQVLCNPSTRRFKIFPYPKNNLIFNFFGYDPIDKQLSVLSISKSESPPDSDSAMPYSYDILKLGSGNGKPSWRSLHCPLPHSPSPTSICINGILYFHFPTHKIACLDLNSEEFKFIDEPPWLPQRNQPHLLVNFKGKLGGIGSKWKDLGKFEFKYEFELSLWVLEDVEKQEWSKHVYVLPSRSWNTRLESYFIAGLTGNGDIVFALRYATNPLYVYFFNLERNILQKVEIKGPEELFKRGETYLYYFDACVDYVEDLRFLS